MTKRSSPIPGPQSPGPGVDAQGLPVIDPTANVLAVVDAAVQRQDDLRDMEHQRLIDMADLRAYYEEKLRDKESQRIDAIRAVDVQAVQQAAQVQAAQATALASQVATSAEAMRAQVAAAATASTTALAAALEPIQKDVADLRRVQYEQQGQRVAQTEGRDSNQWVIATIIAAIVAVAVIVTLVMLLTNTGHSTVQTPVVSP